MYIPFPTLITATLLSLTTMTSAAVTANTNATNGIGSTPSQRLEIDLAQAQCVISAAIAQAKDINIPQNVAVVNPAGLLIAFAHMDNAYLGSIDISMKKARTSVLLNGVASGALYAQAQPGAPLYGIEETNGGLVVSC